MRACEFQVGSQEEKGTNYYVLSQHYKNTEDTIGFCWSLIY